MRLAGRPRERAMRSSFKMAGDAMALFHHMQTWCQEQEVGCTSGERDIKQVWRRVRDCQ
jgi:hypothetical protein